MVNGEKDKSVEMKPYFQSAFKVKQRRDFAKEDLEKLDLVSCSDCAATYSWLLAKCPQCGMENEGKTKSVDED